MTKILNFKVIMEQDADGLFVASVPAIPGCHTQGKTYEEALKNIKDAINLCLDVSKELKNYRDKITFPDELGTKFIGVIDLPIYSSSN